MTAQYSKNLFKVDGIHQRLDALLAECDAALTRRRDPVDFLHRYGDPRDREVVGLIAASLAFGNAVAARQSIDRALAVLGPHPAETILEASRTELQDRFRGFVHRIYRGEHLAALLWQAALLLREHETMGRAFSWFHAESDGDFRESLARFADALRGGASSRSMRHLVSDPRAGSACKRLLLYSRWMIRPADGIDLGLWSIAPRELVIPVDTHVHRISRNLGLTNRRTASWATAEEITAALRRFDPDDPVKYDFALCHLGVSRDCPSRPDLAKCERCVLQDVCGVWTSRRPRRSTKESSQLGL
ncbi:MAG TPA: TIGR02757 family protein [Polyangiales bacterium]|nr:TIGR02757 family protein [Polyangiales bacterium]